VNVDLITHISGESAEVLHVEASARRTAALATATDLQPLTGSPRMFSFCSVIVKTNRERRATN
jgi:hypothetical protein